ncbi:CPBP family intramembrane glutamic endopeptidase [Arthrobacter sp. Leaf234]|uniref:CPBP family intramembrane glutamic endopeptidase n=1 Tax=Arthrobacter sp. Leaf234 TaxID=1736303 RepID=UPI000A9F7AF2|nr:CPBP family intramembrane glutamic endopeptidase [Arthrobacter sp. Leaf234]
MSPFPGGVGPAAQVRQTHRGYGADAAGPVVTLRQAGWALMFVVLYVAAACGVILVLGLTGLVDFTLELLVPVLLGTVTAAALAALSVHLVRRNHLTAAQLGFRRPGPRMAHLLWQIPAAISGALVLQGVFLAVLGLTGFDIGAAPTTNDPLADLAGLPVPVVLFVVLVVAVLTPLWEEVLFRGAFLDGFGRRFRPALAVLLSAALFAAVHLVVVGFAYLFALGVALALLRRFHGNLWAPILLHAVNNGLAVLIVLSGT